VTQLADVSLVFEEFTTANALRIVSPSGVSPMQPFQSAQCLAQIQQVFIVLPTLSSIGLANKPQHAYSSVTLLLKITMNLAVLLSRVLRWRGLEHRGLLESRQQCKVEQGH